MTNGVAATNVNSNGVAINKHAKPQNSKHTLGLQQKRQEIEATNKNPCTI